MSSNSDKRANSPNGANGAMGHYGGNGPARYKQRPRRLIQAGAFATPFSGHIRLHVCPVGIAISQNKIRTMQIYLSPGRSSPVEPGGSASVELS